MNPRGPSIFVTVDGIERIGSVSIGLGRDGANRRIVFLGPEKMMRRIQADLRKQAVTTAAVPEYAVLSATEAVPA